MEIDESPAERAFIGFKCPPELHQKALARMAGHYNSISEYLRDLVRRDIEKSKTEQQTSVS